MAPFSGIELSRRNHGELPLAVIQRVEVRLLLKGQQNEDIHLGARCQLRRQARLSNRRPTGGEGGGWWPSPQTWDGERRETEQGAHGLSS